MTICGKCGKQKASFQAPVDAGTETPGHPLQQAKNGYKYICPYAGCNVSSFPNADRFRRHLVSRHKKARTRHQCFFCLEELTTTDLYIHLIEYHPGIREELQKLLDTGAAGDIAVKYKISKKFIDDQWMLRRQLHRADCLLSSFIMKDGELETVNRSGKEAVSRQFDDAIHIYNGKQALLTPEELVVKESKLRVAQEAGDKWRKVRQATKDRGEAQRRLRLAEEDDKERKQRRKRKAKAQRIWRTNQPPGQETTKHAAWRATQTNEQKKVRRVARLGERARRKKAAELAEEAMPPEERAVAEAARKAVEEKKRLRENLLKRERQARKVRLKARAAATNAEADTEDESSDSDDDDLHGENDALGEAEGEGDDEDEDLRADIDALGDEVEDEDWETTFDGLSGVPPPNLL
jgi:hypothetical protein